MICYASAVCGFISDARVNQRLVVWSATLGCIGGVSFEILSHRVCLVCSVVSTISVCVRRIS